MNQKGNRYDNAPVETFFRSIKDELVRHSRFDHYTEARYAIVEFIELFYNRRRLHQALGYCRREDFEWRAGDSLSICPLLPGHRRKTPTIAILN